MPVLRRGTDLHSAGLYNDPGWRSGRAGRSRAGGHRRVAGRSLGNIHKYSGDSFCPELLQTPVITDLFHRTGVAALVTSLFAPDARYSTHAQIALRFPEYRDQTNNHPPHIDGFPTPYNGIDKGLLCRQTLLVGIYLSRAEQQDMGNFAVWPGSHRRVAAAYRSADGGTILKTQGPQALLKTLMGMNPGTPEQILTEPGDVVLAHGSLVHSVATNLSLQLRYAVYFRVYLQADNPENPEPFGDATRFFAGLTSRQR
jgi:hypothetical protein